MHPTNKYVTVYFIMFWLEIAFELKYTRDGTCHNVNNTV